MRAADLVGVATIVLRDAQHLAALEVAGDALVLTLMRYSEELVDIDGLSFPRVEPRKGELAMARTLVEQLADKWDPEQYTDEYRKNLMKIVKAKLKGKEARLEAPAEPRQAEVVDLMERLRRSLEGASGRKTAAPRRAAPDARRTRGARRKSLAASSSSGRRGKSRRQRVA